MMKVMNRRVEFEMALIKLCGNVNITAKPIDNSEIYDKIKQLEHKISTASFAPVGDNPPTRKNEMLTATSPASEAEPVPNVDASKVRPEDFVPCEKWEEVLEEFRKLNPAVAGSLEGSEAATAGNVIMITSKNRFFITLLKSSKENAVSLGRAIFNVLGQRYAIRAKCTTTEAEQKSMAEQLINKAKANSIETAVDNE